MDKETVVSTRLMNILMYFLKNVRERASPHRQLGDGKGGEVLLRYSPKTWCLLLAVTRDSVPRSSQTFVVCFFCDVHEGFISMPSLAHGGIGLCRGWIDRGSSRFVFAGRQVQYEPLERLALLG